MSDSVSAGQVSLDLVVNQNNFSTQMSKVTSLAKKAGVALAAAFSVKALTNFAQSCIELGSDLTEVQNVVDVTFPTMSATIDEFAQSAAANFGLSETMAKRYAGTLGSMAEAFGFTESQAAEMATTLTGLAGDVASFYNITQDEAYTKLKSVFTGETESLKDLGIVMTQTALDEYALANGFGKTTSAMSEAEKVALRYAFVQDQLSNATGDFARTASTSWANQVRILTLQFESLKSVIGQGLIKVFLPVIKVVNNLLGKVLTLAKALASLFGTSISTSATTVSDTASDAADSYSAASDAADSTAASTSNAAKAANKLKRSLMGFDEITKVDSTDSTDSSDSGSSGGSSGSSTSLGSVDLDSSSLDDATDSASKLSKMFDNVRKACKKLKTSFGAFVDVVKGGGKWVYDNVLVPLGKWTIKKLVPKLIELLAAAFDVLTAAAEALQPLWQWLWDNLFKKIAKFAGDAIISFLTLLVDWLEKLANWISNHQTAFTVIVTGILGLLAVKKVFGVVSSFKKKFEAFQLVWQGAGTVKEVAEDLGVNIGGFGKTLLNIKGTFTKIGGVFKKFGSSIVGWVAANPILAAIIVAIVALVAACILIWKNWDKIKNTKFGKFLTKIAKSFKELWQTLKKKVVPIIETLKEVWNAIKSKAPELIANAKEKVEGALETLKEGWDIISDKAAELVAEAKEKVSGAIDTLKTGWESVTDRAATLVGEAKEKASGALATMKSGWESIKDKAASLVGEAKEKASGAIATLKSGWDSIADKTAEMKAKVGTAWADLKEKWNNLTDHFSDVTASMKAKVASAWSDLKSKWSNITSNISDKTADMKAKVATAWSDLKSKWSGITGNIVDKTASMKAKIATTWSNLKTKWNSLLSNFKDKTCSISLKFSAAASDLKDWVNTNVIDKINNVWAKVPVLKNVKIPHLAQGGYVAKNTPQLAMIGDNRHEGEVTAPESKMQEMAKQAAELAGNAGNAEIISLLRQLLTVVSNLDTTVYLDGKEITKNVVKRVNDKTKATGTCEIIM